MKKLITIVLILVVNLMFAQKIMFQESSPGGLKITETSENTRIFTNTISEMDVNKMAFQGQNFTTFD
ncbi:MAG: hypothetical protein LBH22_00420, partial [Bacteroidales bacterium]|nr:hypothetical protein [Bacteroidales bacterium]